MASFKSTPVSTLPAVIEPLSDSAQFWKKNLQPATVYKELSAINSIDINSAGEILATSSSRISLYDVSSLEVKRSFNAPNHALLYCGTFRQDNSVFAAGCSDGIIRVWNVKKNKPLRMLGSSGKGHTAAVHRVNFNSLDQLFSASDDKTIKLWDIAEESVVCKFGEEASIHNDYIRASCYMEKTSSLVSGSYDHTVKVWDHRVPKKCTFHFSQGAPVESLTYRDFMIISSGENTIKIFDIVAGKVCRTLENAHHKTITCVHNHGSSLLTASIDGHLKIYDINFNTIAAFSYVPSQLLSCYYNSSILAVGSTDGILSVNKVTSSSSRSRRPVIQNEPTDELLFDSIPLKKKSKLDLGSNTFVVRTPKKGKYLSKHDELLRKFKHSDALTRVLKDHGKDQPEIVVNLMQELIRRGALKTALAGRNDRYLKMVVNFLIVNLDNLSFNRVLIDVALALVEVYTNQINRSSGIMSMFKSLSQRVNMEIDSMKQMSQVSGQLQLIINSQIK